MRALGERAEARLLATQGSRVRWVLGLLAPLAFIVIILVADATEGPKTAYVGVLAVVPMFSAVFARPMMTASVAVIAWISAFAFGQVSTDGNVTAQTVRLFIIAGVGIIATIAAYVRTRREQAFVDALIRASEADDVKRQASTDFLTGLLNRRGLLEQILAKGSAERTLAIVDCDNLKKVNDELGHVAGDEFIQAIGGRLLSNISKTDLVGRWGGDEFLIVLDLPQEQAEAVLARVHRKVVERPISTQAGLVPSAFSVGMTGWPAGESLDLALARADKALYSAKDAGRNRIAHSAA
jgi:diguanylate cyclase (GGDEF)-like protein